MADVEYYEGASTGAQIDAEVQQGLVTVNCGTISSLPFTKTNANILPNHVVLSFVIGSPSAMGSQWTVETAAGSLTITGTLLRSTSLILRLGRNAQTI